MRALVVALPLSLLACGADLNPELVGLEPVAQHRAALSVVELETRIGSTAVDYKDPEYLVTPSGAAITFLDRDNAVWLGSLDGAGRLVPPDGRGQRLGTNGPYLRSANGPEFGVSARGVAVVWTGLDGRGVRQFFMHRGGVTTQLTHGDVDLAANLPCKDPTAPSQKILGFTLVGGVQEWFWLSEDAPEERHPVPLGQFGTQGPWWYLDSSRILSNSVIDGVTQLVLVEPSGQQRALTSGPGDKIDMQAFRSPLDGSVVALAITKDARRSSRLSFYAVNEQQPSATSLRDVTFRGDLRSPEPFVFGPHAGASVVVPGRDGNQIVLVRLDGQILTVSGAGALARTDPETFVLGDRLYVSTYATNTAPIALFHSALAP